MKKQMRHMGRIAALLIAAYGCGTVLGLIIQQAAPEPELCALHDLAGRYHAPALMNLATGEIVEMRVYETKPTRPWEIKTHQRTDYVFLYYGAGLSGFTHGGQSSHVDLPQFGETMDNELFCRKCRWKLSLANGKGYALLDLHDSGNMRPYAIAKGKTYEINGYSVSIKKGHEALSLSIDVTGHYGESSADQ